MDRLMDIALWGQPPVVAARVREDWESYLADYRAENDWLDTLFMTLRACASHINWRVTSGEMPTTVPTLLSLTGIAICLLLFPLVEPAASTSADFHISVGAALFMIALARKPWQIGHSKLLSTSMIIGGTGGFHLALRFSGMGPAAADVLMIIGHLVLAIGLTGAGVSGLLTKTAFGSHRGHMMLLGGGLGIVISANLLVALSLDNILLIGLVFSLVLAEIGLLSQIPRLVEISERTSSSEMTSHAATA